MLHDTIAAAVRKLKDSNGQYIWQMSTIAGTPDRLDGYPVVYNNDMSASLAASEKVMEFGQLDAYVIRDAGSIEIVRADELFLLNGQVAFVAFQRSDGNLADTSAVKHLAMHA